MTDPYIEKEEQTSCYDSKDPNCKMLPAEKLFDQAVYGGISYWAQALTGIMLARWIKYGSAKPYYDEVCKWIGPKIYRWKDAATAAKDIASPLTVTIMIMVGNTFLLPVKWLENNKPQHVRRINDWLNKRRTDRGEIISEAELSEQQAHLETLDRAPKQTWASLLGGRAFGLAAVYTVLFGMGTWNEKTEAGAAKYISGGLRWFGLKKLSKSPLLEQFIKVGFLDVFYSAVSAGGLYVYSHWVNPPKDYSATSSLTPPPAQDPLPTEAIPNSLAMPLAALPEARSHVTRLAARQIEAAAAPLTLTV